MDGRRIVKADGDRTKSGLRAERKEALRDYEDGPPAAPSELTLAGRLVREFCG